MKKNLLATLFLGVVAMSASGQGLSGNPYKFLGNITTRGNVDAGGGVPQYFQLWNQITCENESKWASVEGSRGNFNWSGADRAFNYAKQHDFTYKFHALVWGSQYPSWLDNLSAGLLLFQLRIILADLILYFCQGVIPCLISLNV